MSLESSLPLSAALGQQNCTCSNCSCSKSTESCSKSTDSCSCSNCSCSNCTCSKSCLKVDYIPDPIIPVETVEPISVPTESIIPVETNIPTESITPVETDIPTDPITPVETNIPTESIIPVETDIPTESIIPVETDIPTESTSIPTNLCEENTKTETLVDPDMPDFMQASILQHQIDYHCPLVPQKTVLSDTPVVLEDIYFNSEKVDPILNSISSKFKDEKKKEIKHYMPVTKKMENKTLLSKIETRKPSFYTGNPLQN